MKRIIKIHISLGGKWYSAITVPALSSVKAFWPIQYWETVTITTTGIDGRVKRRTSWGVTISQCSLKHTSIYVEIMKKSLKTLPLLVLVLEYSRVPLYWHGLTLIPAWVSYYIHYQVYDEIIYTFPNFIGTAIEVWEWIINFIPHFTVHIITYPCWD